MISLVADVIATILPTYVTIIIGYIAGRYMHVESRSIAPLLFYIFSPIVMFSGPIYSPLSYATLSLPLITFIMACSACLITYYYVKRSWQDGSQNIIAMSAGTHNMGYFGLPVMMAIFEPEVVGLYIVAIIGISLYENSLGFYIASKGQHTSALEGVKRALRLPTLYAFSLGCAISALGWKVPEFAHQYIQNIRGCYTILGIMQIGIALAALPTFSIDRRFIQAMFVPKFILWPAMTAIVIIIDSLFIHMYSPDMYIVLIMAAGVPLGANTIAIATLLHLDAGKVAAAVALSFLVSLIIMPLMALITLSWG